MIVLCLFCLELLVCVALGWPTVAALLVGLVLFVGWALRQGYGLRAVGGMLWSGIRTAKNVLIVFLLIGVHTAPIVAAAPKDVPMSADTALASRNDVMTSVPGWMRSTA